MPHAVRHKPHTLAAPMTFIRAGIVFPTCLGLFIVCCGDDGEVLLLFHFVGDNKNDDEYDMHVWQPGWAMKQSKINGSETECTAKNKKTNDLNCKLKSLI